MKMSTNAVIEHGNKFMESNSSLECRSAEDFSPHQIFTVFSKMKENNKDFWLSLHNSLPVEFPEELSAEGLAEFNNNYGFRGINSRVRQSYYKRILTKNYPDVDFFFNPAVDLVSLLQQPKEVI